jgi:hypothetical protein
MLNRIKNPKELMGLFFLILKAQGYTEEQIRKMKLPTTRKTIALYIERVSETLNSMGLMHLFSKNNAKLVSVGGSSDIENIEGYSQVNPSNSTRMTSIKRADDYRLSGDSLNV